jgi:hypothetical protein
MSDAEFMVLVGLGIPALVMLICLFTLKYEGDDGWEP